MRESGDLRDFGWCRGGYWIDSCIDCSSDFMGDKKSYRCKPCAEILEKEATDLAEKKMEDTIRERRMGKIRITQDLMDAKNDILLGQMFGMLEFIPVKAEHVYSEMAVVMTGISKYFDLKEYPSEVPSYMITLDTNDEGQLLAINVFKDED